MAAIRTHPSTLRGADTGVSLFPAFGAIALPLIGTWIGVASAYWCSTVPLEWPPAYFGALAGLGAGVYALMSQEFSKRSIQRRVVAVYAPLCVVAQYVTFFMTSCAHDVCP